MTFGAQPIDTHVYLGVSQKYIGTIAQLSRGTLLPTPILNNKNEIVMIH